MDTTPSPPAIQAIWYSFLLSGQAALGVLIVTLVVKRSYLRHLSAFLNVLLFSLITAIIYSLMLYTGTYLDDVVPEDLCIAIAVLKQSVEPASTWSILLFLAEAIVLIRIRMKKKWFIKPHGFIRISRASIPWINMVVWTFVTSFADFTGKDIKATRDRHSFYCNPPVENSFTNHIKTYEVAGLAVLLIILLICAGVTFFRDRLTMTSLLKSREKDNDGYQDVRLFIHATCLGFVVIVCLLITGGGLAHTLLGYVTQSCFPLFTAIALGARPDIWPSRIAARSVFQRVPKPVPQSTILPFSNHQSGTPANLIDPRTVSGTTGKPALLHPLSLRHPLSTPSEPPPMYTKGSSQCGFEHWHW